MEEGRTLLQAGEEEQEPRSRPQPFRRLAAVLGGALLAGALVAAALVSGRGSPAAALGGGALDDLTELVEVAEDAGDLEKDVFEGIPIYTDQGGKPKVKAASGARHVQDYIINLGAEDRHFADDCSRIIFQGKEMPHAIFRGTLQDLKDFLHTHRRGVEFVEQDVKVKAIPEMHHGRRLAPASWGMDRVDEHKLPLDKASYHPGGKQGAGAHVYIFDTGIRTSNSDFEGRAIPTLEVLGRRPVECRPSDRTCAMDRNGHGTHCAGTVGGRRHGVAPRATLHAVKILADSGAGSLSWMDMALDWVVQKGPKPAIVSASLGARGKSRSSETAINNAVGKGVTVVVAAGNENQDACSFTPASVASAITVGSTTSRDDRSSFSNFGTCLDIFAPGSDIVSAGHQRDNSQATMSGTSMACPHVAGAAALLLSADRSLSVPEVRDRLVQRATVDSVHQHGNGSPDKLLYVGGGGNPPAPTRLPSPDGSSCSKDGWTVKSGPCTVDARCCLRSPGFPRSYSKNTMCEVTVGRAPGAIKSETFATEAGYDTLTVNSVKFSGSDAPHGLVPHGKLTWSADFSVQARGFNLCLPELGAPCPRNGWKKPPSCLSQFKWKGKTYADCTEQDHENGWCATSTSRKDNWWADCTRC